ncbi:MAG: hypothetical protein P1U65_17345 [Minwuia sp.]|nr:hypothetical protein [Minwuia sp.]
MPDKKPKTPSKRNKKDARKPAPRNRYHRRAKLSEYKFLQVLRGFADDMTATEAAVATGVSIRTVRPLFERFRDALMRAVFTDRFAFGWAGYFLFEKDQLSVRGTAIIDAVIGSDLMRQIINRHDARLNLTGTPGVRFSQLAFETVVRVFCTLSMQKDNDTLYSEEIRQAYAELQLVALYIHLHKEGPDDPELFEAVVSSFERIMKDFAKLLEMEELSHLIDGHTPHRFTNNVFYEDLRRYLLKNPL